MKKLFGNFKSIRPVTVAVAFPLTLAYPIFRSVTASSENLMIFSDTLFITSLILIALGVFFVLARFGDFDITRFIFHRGTNKNAKSFEDYKKDKEEERAQTFNYPLFFGLVYLIASGLTALIC